jgi:threonine dehydrogenase-like Zn-dependent dehydrogenase
VHFPQTATWSRPWAPCATRSSPGAHATQPERVCVIGCGTIGGLFVAHLAQLPDVEVWADDADPADVAAINRMVGRNETRARKTEG